MKPHRKMNCQRRNDEGRASDERARTFQRRRDEVANGKADDPLQKPNPSRSDGTEKGQEEDDNLVGDEEGGDQAVAVTG